MEATKLDARIQEWIEFEDVACDRIYFQLVGNQSEYAPANSENAAIAEEYRNHCGNQWVGK